MENHWAGPGPAFGPNPAPLPGFVNKALLAPRHAHSQVHLGPRAELSSCNLGLSKSKIFTLGLFRKGLLLLFKKNIMQVPQVVFKVLAATLKNVGKKQMKFI